MKFKSIYNKAKMKNPSKERKISENYVIQNIIVTRISPLLAYPLHKIGISADTVTNFSFIVIIFASISLMVGHGYVGCSFIIIFGLLDSMDGNLARLNKSKTLHGQTLDTIGADLFYILIPFSISFYLYDQNLKYYYFDKEIIIIGFLISSFLIFNRLFGLRNNILFLTSKTLSKKKINYKRKFTIINLFFLYYENEFIRGNFFSEPGFILNFSILIFIDAFKILYFYLFIILIYIFIKFIKLFIGTIILYMRN
tara:strand:+ start:105 stop:866 length:762 start_codon:yes stop_codon:yes gene_type:complete